MIRKRMILSNWKMVVDNTKQNEILLLKIIINRWWMHTQDMLDRRRVRKVAHRYWMERRLKSCFSKWRSFTENQRLRLRASKFETRRISPSAPFDTVLRRSQDLRRIGNTQQLFTKLPKMTSTSFRYSSVPRMSMKKSSIDYYDDNLRPRAMSRSLSPISHCRKPFQSSHHYPFRVMMPNYNCSQKSFTLLDRMTTPSWVLNAMSNDKLRFTPDDATSNTHYRPLSREKYAEPKTYDGFDRLTPPRLNKTFLSGSKESKLRHQCSKPIISRSFFNDNEYKRYN